MRLRGWYIGLLIGWAILGLPGFILGILWAGGDWRSMLPTSEDHPLGIAVWLVHLTAFLSPLWLAPLGIVRASRQ